MNKHIFLLFTLMSTTICSYATEATYVRLITPNWPEQQDMEYSNVTYGSSSYIDAMREGTYRTKKTQYHDFDLILHYSGLCRQKRITLNPGVERDPFIRVEPLVGTCCLEAIVIEKDDYPVYHQRIEGCDDKVITIGFEGIEKRLHVDIR